ncbi:D-glycero-beta-D-manno-heptose-7-phosphate kinase [Persephonella sp.]
MIDKKRASEIIKRFPEKKVLVVGDLILDRYLWGEVERISPEAPVPVVDVKRESLNLGGACNVAWNISELNGKVYIAGVVGDDLNGETLIKMLEESGINPVVVKDSNRPTTEKTRIIAVSQQLMRIDREKKDRLSQTVLNRLISSIQGIINEIDAVIVSDYGKGVITRKLMDFLRTTGKPVFVDPKPSNFSLYKGITIMTPNRKEAYECVKKDRSLPVERIGFEIKRKLGIDHLLITLGSEGMALFEGDKITKIPARAKKVYDVTGAGDTVISVLTLAKISGASWQEASSLANYAAGYVVGEIGTAAISRDTLLSILP